VGPGEGHLKSGLAVGPAWARNNRGVLSRRDNRVMGKDESATNARYVMG